VIITAGRDLWVKIDKKLLALKKKRERRKQSKIKSNNNKQYELMYR